MAPKAWLDDTAIEAFLMHIVEADESTFMLTSQLYGRALHQGYDATQQWNQLEFVVTAALNKGKLFVPININESHWALATVNFATGMIEYRDSYSELRTHSPNTHNPV